MADAIVLSNVVPVDGAGAQSRHPLTLAETFQRSLTPPKAIPFPLPLPLYPPFYPPFYPPLPPFYPQPGNYGLHTWQFLKKKEVAYTFYSQRDFFCLTIIWINPVILHKRSYLEGKSGVSGGVSKSPLFVRFDSSVADRSCKPILKTVRKCYKYKNKKYKNVKMQKCVNTKIQ